jgi:hypothetical protein
MDRLPACAPGRLRTALSPRTSAWYAVCSSPGNAAGRNLTK